MYYNKIMKDVMSKKSNEIVELGYDEDLDIFRASMVNGNKVHVPADSVTRTIDLISLIGKRDRELSGIEEELKEEVRYWVEDVGIDINKYLRGFTQECYHKTWYNWYEEGEENGFRVRLREYKEEGYETKYSKMSSSGKGVVVKSSIDIGSDDYLEAIKSKDFYVESTFYRNGDMHLEVMKMEDRDNGYVKIYLTTESETVDGVLWRDAYFKEHRLTISKTTDSVRKTSTKIFKDKVMPIGKYAYIALIDIGYLVTTSGKSVYVSVKKGSRLTTTLKDNKTISIFGYDSTGRDAGCYEFNVNELVNLNLFKLER